MTAVRVLGSATNTTNVELVRRWCEVGLDATLVAPFEAERSLPAESIVVGRLDVLPTLDGVEPGLITLFRLERMGMPVLNHARTLVSAHDKLLTAKVLRRAGLSHPRTAGMRAGQASPLPPPLVLKPRLGSWGRDVFRCRDRAELERALDAVRSRPWFLRHGALVQELLPSPGYDIRLVVAGGEVIASSERVAAPREWRTNVSLGGSLRPAEPNAAARSLATRAAAALGGDLVGVDLMPVDGGYVVLELNGAVDFDERYSLDGRDVYLEAARALGLAQAASAFSTAASNDSSRPSAGTRSASSPGIVADWAARVEGYETMAITADDLVLTTPGFPAAGA